MKRKILVDRGEVLRIAKLLGCTREMVSYSINFQKNSLLARKIRKVAMERGGFDTGEFINKQNN